MTGLGEALRMALTDHIGTKLFSIAAAIVIFSVVHGAEDAQRSFFVDIVALLPPADTDRVLVSELPDQVRVTVRGSQSMLNSIRREEIEPLQIELTDTSLRYYYLEREAFNFPTGLSIVQLAPASIPLTWSTRVERSIPITAQLSGQPGHGLMVQEPIRVDPPRIIVEGAQSEVDPLGDVKTEPLDISGLGQGVHRMRVRLERTSPHAEYRGETMVRATIEVVPEVYERVISGLSVEIVGPGGRVRPDTVDVKLRGPAALIENTEPSRLVPWVDASAPALTGTLPLPVQLRGVPEGAELLSIEPQEVLVSVVPR